MNVTRVQTGNSSHVEPPLDQSWDELTKLRWHAAVVAYDTGLSVAVKPGRLSVRRFGQWREVPGRYSVHVGRSSCGPYTFRDAWLFLNGVDTGCGVARQSSDYLKETT